MVEFLGNATGLVFPINWREPFGLAMIEAMACGTPVLAMGNGSVPEVVDEGVTGFIVAEEAAAAEPAPSLGDVLPQPAPAGTAAAAKRERRRQRRRARPHGRAR